MVWIKRLSILVLIAAALGAGFFWGESSVEFPYCQPTDADFSILWEAWHRLKDSYVRPGELDNQKLVWGATKGMVEAVGDSYTVFFNPGETKDFLADVSGEFEGIGIEIGIRNDQLQVIAPLEGTPAASAGLRAGDKIIKIDGSSTVGMTVEEAVTIIRGPNGTEVTLTIAREGSKDNKDITIKRGVIKVPSLEWKILDGNVAYIKLYQFSNNIDSDFQDAGFKILDTNADRIVLDLRNNPGGYLEMAQYVSGWFLARGKTVVIEDFRQNQKKEVYEARGNSKFMDYPVVVIVNEGTASASEILAAALRENRGIQLIGKTSYGKGSVQLLEDLKDGSSLKVTVADWLTPDGNQITGKGLAPDVEVDLTDDDYNQNKDPQLDKALEIIKNM